MIRFQAVGNSEMVNYFTPVREKGTVKEKELLVVLPLKGTFSLCRLDDEKVKHRLPLFHAG